MKVTVPKGTMITLECGDDDDVKIPSEVEITFSINSAKDLNGVKLDDKKRTLTYFYDGDKLPRYGNRYVFSITLKLEDCIISK